MQKKYWIYLFVVALPFLWVACSDDDNDDKEWKAENRTAYDKIVQGADTIDWTLIDDTPPGVGSGVYYHVVKSGAGKENPLQTATVKLLHKGYYYTGDIFNYGTSGTTYVSTHELVAPGNPDYVYLLWEGDTYTSYTWSEGENEFQPENFDIGETFLVNGVVRGLSIALQNMVVGDQWKICIPYNLGYGSSGYYVSGIAAVRSYSTLFFDVELLEINQHP